MYTLTAPLTRAEFCVRLNGDGIVLLELGKFIAEICYGKDHLAADVIARSLRPGAPVTVTATHVDPPQSFGRGLYVLRGAALV